jgi:hypothetical protein
MGYVSLEKQVERLFCGYRDGDMPPDVERKDLLVRYAVGVLGVVPELPQRIICDAGVEGSAQYLVPALADRKARPHARTLLEKFGPSRVAVSYLLSALSNQDARAQDIYDILLGYGPTKDTVGLLVGALGRTSLKIMPLIC